MRKRTFLLAGLLLLLLAAGTILACETSEEEWEFGEVEGPCVCAYRCLPSASVMQEGCEEELEDSNSCVDLAIEKCRELDLELQQVSCIVDCESCDEPCAEI